MENLRARDFRRMGHETCKPYAGTLALITLVYLILVAVVAYIPLGALICTGPFTLSYIIIIKKAYSKETPEFGQLFSGFSKFVEAFLTYLIETIFLFLWFLLLIIPGIIKSYSYAMTFYILEDEGIAYTEAITKSRQMMNGYKWRLFCLHLSYIGWIILCILTLGILYLWVGPRMTAADYNFYLKLKENNK